MSSNPSALRRALAKLHLYWHALLVRAAEDHDTAHQRHLRRLMSKRRPVLKIASLVVAALVGVSGLACGFVWWRLGEGPVSVDRITPWLIAAIEERLGGRHRIEVGGSQLERDENGRTALRLVDIIVRDVEGAILATAPKAEVGISVSTLLAGNLRPVRLSLIGAEMAVRIEPEGEIVVFTGAERRPIATAPGGRLASAVTAPATPTGDSNVVANPAPRAAEHGSPDVLAALTTWIDSLDALGLDGGELTEVGLKNGSLTVEDRRSGKRWTFANINLALTRPKEGGAALALNSIGADGPWSLTATVTPRSEGGRAIEAVVRDLSAKDILLALRFDTAGFEANAPISAALRAEIGPDGTVSMAEGRVIVGAGHIGNPAQPENRISIEEAHAQIRWHANTRTATIPIEFVAGPNRFSLVGQVEPPRAAGEPWTVAIPRGMALLASSVGGHEPPLILDRMAVRLRIDPANRLVQLEQGDLVGGGAGVALTGTLNYADEPRLALGVAGTRMSVSSLKRLWPYFVAPKVRTWVIDHIQIGQVERVEIATNATLHALSEGGPPIPEEGLSVDIRASGASVRPVDTLPPVRDADLSVRVTGRTATVTAGRGAIDLPSGRKLAIANVKFAVPDTVPKEPPAKARFRLEGAAEAVAELLAMERLHERTAGIPFDPSTARGSFAGEVTLSLQIAENLPREAIAYGVEADLTNFSADRVLRNQKIEAGTLRMSASPLGLQIKGDVRVAGVPASIDYRKLKADADAELRVQATLDDAARSRLGLEDGNAVTGPIPIKLQGRIAADRDARFSVDADLTHARLVDLLPGWSKPAGKSARATFSLIDKGQAVRLEDLIVEGSGASVRGSVEIDQRGELVSANFPTFAPVDGDKASLRIDRGSDGTLKVTLRGDVYDGRGFLKAALAGSTERKTGRIDELDLDIKVGAVVGHRGEALRGVDLKLSRRDGHIRSLGLNAKLGRDGTLVGELRGRSDGKPTIYVETNDAGALFRFTDTYQRVFGGQMWLTMEPPTPDNAPQDGILNVRDFSVRGEPALERVASTGPASDSSDGMARPVGNIGVGFSRMRVDFTRSAGKLSLQNGVVWGPAIGATVDGTLDYQRDEVRLRGTFVPAYALNNMIARVPIVGLFLGGGANEGLLGVTYEVVGAPGAPVLRVNPISAIAPGFLRKLFEFRGTEERAGAEMR